MIAQRARGLRNLLTAFQVVGACLLFWCEVLLLQMYYVANEEVPLRRYLVYSGLVGFALLFSEATRKQEKSTFLHPSFPEAHRRALRQTWYVAVGLFMFLVTAKDMAISRVFLFTFLLSLYPLLLISNRFVPSKLADWVFGGRRQDNTLLIGKNGRLKAIIDWSRQKRSVGLNVIGVLSDETPEHEIHGLPVIGRLVDLEQAIQRFSVNQVILLDLPTSRKELLALVDVCERLGVRFLALSDFEERFGHAATLFEDDGLCFIGLREEPLQNPMNRILKRGLDLAVSLPVVALLLPATTVVVWMFQRFQSPGPVFYRQRRAGLQNEPFDILKYRTMHVDNPDETRQARAGDERIYPVGKWFRKLSIDELPQFLNVLRGQMSVVGPRPHLLEHNSRFEKVMKNYQVRTYVKPGITGLAQVRGLRGETRTEMDLTDRVRSDIFYLENWSFTLDCSIITRTLWQVFRPPVTAF